MYTMLHPSRPLGDLMGSEIVAAVSRKQRFSRLSLNESQKAAVRGELEAVLKSAAFRGSRRASELLSYIVERRLNEQEELLKERTIGIEVFGRAPDYATGENPVVRVHATELRRRLAQYYSNGQEHALRIDLPVGSYVPEFRWAAPRKRAGVRLPRLHGRSRVWAIGAALVMLIVLYATKAYVGRARAKAQPDSLVHQFWAPVLQNPQPVMLCVGTSVVYGVSPEVYEKYEAAHHPGQAPGLEAVILPPAETLQGSDIFPIRDQYIGVGTAKALTRFTAMFAQIHKPTQIRVGQGFSFADLRSFPSVLMGAFSNPWTLDITKNLQFFFVRDGTKYGVKERRAGGRVWWTPMQRGGKTTQDFAIIARLFSPKTGEPLVIVAGVTQYGTAAAGEFLTTEKYMSEALRNAPATWQAKNLEVVLSTRIVGETPSPPEVAATYFW